MKAAGAVRLPPPVLAALVCVVALALCAPVLATRLSAERGLPYAGIAVVDSVLTGAGSGPEAEARLRAANVRTIVVGMRADQRDRPTGYDLSRLKALAGKGFAIVLGWPTSAPRGSAWLRGRLLEAARVSGARAVMPLGAMPYARELRGLHGPDGRPLELVLPDLIPAAGAEAYAQGGQIVRAHVVPVAPWSSIPSLTTRVRRAEKERGVRLIVLRGPPGAAMSGKDAGATRAQLDALLTLVRSVEAAQPAGIRLGAPSAMVEVALGAVPRLGSVLGALLVLALAGLTVFGDALGRDRRDRAGWLGRAGRPDRWSGRLGLSTARGLPYGAWLVAGDLLAAAVVGIGVVATDSLLAVRALILVTGVTGAVLAALIPMRSGSGRGRGRGVGAYLSGCLVAVTTGVVIAALGTRSALLEGLETFLGVKALLLAPVLIVAVVAWWENRPLGLRRWFRSVPPAYLVIGGVVLLAVLAYYLIRSGNSGLAAGWELSLRDRLDEWLYVRPRFKEAFLGLPALMLAASWRRRGSGAGSLSGPGSGVAEGRLRWVFAIVAAVGTASVVDSFGHFHTPVGVSVLRSVYAVALGLVLGLLAGMVLRLVLRTIDSVVRPGRTASPTDQPAKPDEVAR